MFSVLLYLPVIIIVGWFVYAFFTSRVQPDVQQLASTRKAEPDSMMTYQGEKSGIVLDLESNSITFIKCHMSNGFWTLRATPEFTCSLDDVQAVFHQNLMERGFFETRIVTRHGKAQIYSRKKDEGEDDLRQIRDYLASTTADFSEVGMSSSPFFPIIIAWVLAAVILAAIIYFTN